MNFVQENVNVTICLNCYYMPVENESVRMSGSDILNIFMSNHVELFT